MAAETDRIYDVGPLDEVAKQYIEFMRESRLAVGRSLYLATLPYLPNELHDNACLDPGIRTPPISNCHERP